MSAPIAGRKDQSRGEESSPGSVDAAIARVVRDELQRLNIHDRRMLSLEQAANYLGVSEGTVYNLIAAGKLNPSRYTSRPMFDLFELIRVIEDSKQKHTL